MTLDDDLSQQHDWCWLLAHGKSYMVSGKFVELISPKFSQDSTFYLFTSKFILLLETLVMEHLDCKNELKVPVVKPSPSFLY